MGHERLHHIKDCLLCAIEGQISNLAEVDAAELGEVVDMVKDLEEALYFCTITEAMQGKGGGNLEIEYESNKKNGHHQKGDDQMYYSDPRMYNNSGNYNYAENNGRGGNSNSSRSNYSEPMRMMDYREGRSPQSRRMYMEAKETQKDKAMQMRELEKYMQELSSDVVEMIQDSSPEEKQYLEKKISALAAKIGQMK